MLDELSPIEDSILTTQYGSIKDARYVQPSGGAFSASLTSIARQKSLRGWRRGLPLLTSASSQNRFYPDLKHMGEPLARKTILEWLDKLFKSIPASSSKDSNEADVKALPLVNGHTR